MNINQRIEAHGRQLLRPWFPGNLYFNLAYDLLTLWSSAKFMITLPKFSLATNFY